MPGSLYAFLTPKGLRSKAQGWPRVLRPTLGGRLASCPTLKGLRIGHGTQPLQGWCCRSRIPRVGRKTRGQPWALLRNPFGVRNAYKEPGHATASER